jgi:hypothetical protein
VELSATRTTRTNVDDIACFVQIVQSDQDDLDGGFEVGERQTPFRISVLKDLRGLSHRHMNDTVIESTV